MIVLFFGLKFVCLFTGQIYQPETQLFLIQNSKSVIPGFSIVIMELKCYNVLTVNICPIAFNALKTQVRRIPFMVAFKDKMGKDI